MGENTILLISEFMLPIVFIITGLYLWKFTPQYKGLGYHTAAAERSPAAWLAAQKYCGFRMVVFNIPLLILTAVSWLLCVALNVGEDIMTLATVIKTAAGVILILIAIFMTESMLKRCFDSKGQPK